MPNNRSCELQTSTVEITLEIGKKRLSRAVVKQLSKNINTNLLFIDLIYDLLPPFFDFSYDEIIYHFHEEACLYWERTSTDTCESSYLFHKLSFGIRIGVCYRQFWYSAVNSNLNIYLIANPLSWCESSNKTCFSKY